MTPSDRISALQPQQKRELLAALLQKSGAGGPEIAPLSFAQERLWLIEQLDPGKATYNIPNLIAIAPEFTPAVVERALAEVVRRHETLRTSFIRQADGPVQLIWPTVEIDLKVRDVSSTPPEERQAEIDRCLHEDGLVPFDLARAPLFRAALLIAGSPSNLLLVTAHHAVFDGWSTQLLSHELQILAAAFAAGQPSPLPEIDYQYRNYARWQRDNLRGALLEEHLEYWREQLDASPTLLTIPPDLPRRELPSSRGYVQSFYVPQSVEAALKEIGRQSGATPFMVLLAAFKLFLLRHSGQADLVVGAPVSNRNQPEHEALIGFFINTVVLRTKARGDLTFREFLARVRDSALGAYGHQDLPFEQLVSDLQPERNLNQNPMFQAAFTMEARPSAHSVSADPELPPPPDLPRTESGTAKFDITLGIGSTPYGLAGAFEVRADLFLPETATRLAERFGQLLAGIAGGPDEKLRDFDILPPGERHLVTSEWNQTATPFPDQHCFHHIFEQVVDALPNAIAAEFGDERLSYRELDEAANRLAHHLMSMGASREVRVGLTLNRGLALAIGVLGVMKAGAAFVALDPKLPRERLQYMARDAEVAIIVTEAAVMDLANGLGVPCVGIADQVLTGYLPSRPTNPVASDNLAYVIYTSGSTGRPKGVLVHHRALCNMGASVARDFEMTLKDRVLQVAPLTFDVAIWEMSMSWFVGAALVFANEEEIVSGSVLRERDITVVSYTPSVLSTLRSEDYPGLRMAVSLGERCTERVVSEWAKNRRLVNIYGPSETTGHCTLGELRIGAPVTLGYAIDNARVYVLDDELNPQPIGVPGELHISSVGMARGYLNNPALTAERFVPDPFASEPGARLYKSGDLARLMPNGEIDFLGRIDHQVKVRGFRIELGEIETALMQVDDVSDAVVMVREDEPDQRRLVAYVVSRASTALNIGQLHGRMRQRLPEYMVPAAIVQLGELPRNSSGKADRKALPPPGTARLMPRHTTPPRTETERKLADIWASVLSVCAPGIHDNFFDLGGHSLLGTRLLLRIREGFGVELPLRAVFQNGTIAELAQLIDRQDSDVESQRIVPVARGNGRANYEGLS